MRQLLILFICLVIKLPGIQAQQSIDAIEDSYVRGGSYQQTNYGTSELLEVKSAPNYPEFTRKAYLKFDLSSWQKEQVSSAVLFIFASELQATFQLTASLTNDNWDETVLNWENAPAEKELIDSVKLGNAGKLYGIDVTSAFLKEYFGDGILSILMSDRAVTDNLCKFISTEASQNAPLITIFTDEDTLISPPELILVEYTGNEQCSLNWNDHSNKETGFVVEKRTNDGSFIPVDTTTFNITSFIDTQVIIGNAYFYRVKAFNPFGDSDYSPEKSLDLSATDVPCPVSQFSGSAISSGQVKLTWGYQETATGFYIYRSVNGSEFFLKDIVGGDRRDYTDKKLLPETSYQYYIQACNYIGCSASSDSIIVTTVENKAYYFDAFLGSDTHPVNSIETPWRSLDKLNSMVYNPGDRILLKAGSTWEGQIVLKQSGLEGFPVTLSSYGSGARPKINGNGAEGAVITMNNVSYWNISNLEITNPASAQSGRIGVFISATGGNHGHLHLDNLHIHDIFGRYSFEMIGKNTGGIGIIGENDARFDDILIENCTIEDIVRVGIFTNGNTGIRGDRPITNLVIRNNKVNRCAGDGMIIRYADRPLIEHNLAMENHNANEDLVKYGVAIWVRSTDEAIIQYNRVFNTRGSMDGQAFDADLDAWRTLVQYNYTSNNEGGFMLVYGSSEDAIVRYNISQNDGLKGKHILDFPIWTNPRGSGIFHNNIFYIGEEIDAVLADEALSTAKIYNNIVINRGGGALTVPSNNQTAEFSNNCLVGYSAADASINKNPVEGDPELLGPGSGITEFSSLEGYKISPESPCIGSGLPFDQMEGSYWFEGEVTDFWGNPIIAEFVDVGVQQISTSTELIIPRFEKPDKIKWDISPVPFTDGFLLSLDLATSSEVMIAIYDIYGIHLDTIFSGKMQKGLNSLFYNLHSESGSMQGSGLYVVQINASQLHFNDSEIIIAQ